MYRSLFSGVAGLAAVALGAAASVPAQADEIGDFYKDKSLTIIVGFGAGGTYGKYSQIIAKFLRPHIPGKPNILVQHMPGAGGIKATNYAANVLPKDGSAVLMPPDSIIISELLRPNAVRYRTGDFTWLGNLIESNSVVVLRKDARIQSFDQVKSEEVVMASTGKGSQTFLVPSMLNGVFNTKFKIVMGYKGSRGSLLSMERGETQGVSLTWLAFATGKPEWFKGPHESWEAQPIVQVGFKKEKDLPWVPLASDLAASGEDRQIVDFIASLGPIGRGLAFPPGVPEKFVAPMRAAFDKMAEDPVLAKEAKSRKLRINPKSGKEVQDIVEKVLKMPPKVVERAQTLIMGSSS